MQKTFFSDYLFVFTVPRALESQFKIDSLYYSPQLGDTNSLEFKNLAEMLESELKRILFTTNDLYYGASNIQLKVVEFT